ncbi:MAG: hypothetical protein PHQ74_10925 [Crocinitomicaceae bacterium]|nr:hypothetical protein [Crocinitomicaceae bacterium]
MKKFVAYILLMGFITQSFSQLWVMTSFYINREYIAENVCINRFEAIPVCKGQCFLDEKLKENENKQEQRLPDLKQYQIQLFQPVDFFSFDFQTNVIYKEITYGVLDQNFNTSEFTLSIFQPPQTA